MCTLTMAPLAFSQKLELNLDNVAAKASAKHEVDLDGALLKTALANLPQLAAKHAKEAEKVLFQLPALLSAVTGVYVRNYGFEKPEAYSDNDLDGIRKQVGDGSGWMRIVRVKEKGQSTEIYLLSHGEEIAAAWSWSQSPNS